MALTDAQSASLAESEERWQQEKTQQAAAEFAAAQTVAGEPVVDPEVLELLMRSDLEAVRRLASKDRAVNTQEAPLPNGRLQVASAKAKVRRDPRSAIAWADLARRYVALGQNSQAEQSLTIARSLAPDSRYLLRSSARFYVHVEQPDRSLALLTSSPRHKTDPWLLASSLAITAMLGKKVGLSRATRTVLDSGSFRPIELTELRSEFATLQLAAGQDRRARQFFRDSLTEPNDNALAQAEWASKRARLDLELEGYSVPFASEAHAKRAASNSDWNEALARSLEWLDDEPFDPRAAAFGSFVAATGLEDWQSCVELSTAGLIANPNDPLLLNNLAFGRIELGDLEGARQALLRAERSDPVSAHTPALRATAGLLSFRSGDPELGRSQYRDAIRLGHTEGPDVALLAMSMLLREEIRADVKLDTEVLSSASRIRQMISNSPAAAAVFDRVQKLAAAPEKSNFTPQMQDFVSSQDSLRFKTSLLALDEGASGALELPEATEPET